ncbi:MAG: F0F1 ATP synthase subunit epsilon [Bacillota bacterium]
MKGILLEVVTPERKVYSREVEMVIARAIDGDIGVLRGHTPLVTALQPWVLRARIEENEERMAVSGGFMEVTPEKITILAETAELASEIDVERAKSARQRAEARLAGEGLDDEETDQIRAEAALRRAMARLRAVGIE